MRLIPKAKSKPLAALQLPTFDLLSEGKRTEVKTGFSLAIDVHLGFVAHRRGKTTMVR